MRMYTTTEITFTKRPDGLYQEHITRFIVIEDASGNKTTKVDNRQLGRVFKEDNSHNSFHGETTYTFADDGVTRRLIALSNFQQG
jgi:hypothetical protein